MVIVIDNITGEVSQQSTKTETPKKQVASHNMHPEVLDLQLQTIEVQEENQHELTTPYIADVDGLLDLMNK